MHNENIFGSVFLYTPYEALTSINVIKKYKEFGVNENFPNNVLVKFGLDTHDTIQAYGIDTYKHSLIEGLIILKVSNFTLIRRFICHLTES